MERGKIEYDLNSAQVAKMFGVTQKTIIRWANAGRFGFITVESAKGVRYKFSSAEIGEYMEENQPETYIIQSNKKEESTVETKIEQEGTNEQVQKPENNTPTIEGEAIFKDLFLQKEDEVKELNNQLQKASYHIAQLEEQIKARIPMIEHRTQMEKIEERSIEMEAKVIQIKKQLEKEKIINISFFVLSAIVLIEAIIYMLF